MTRSPSSGASTREGSEVPPGYEPECSREHREAIGERRALVARCSRELGGRLKVVVGPVHRGEQLERVDDLQPEPRGGGEIEK
jgi:hypothetical protein